MINEFFQLMDYLRPLKFRIVFESESQTTLFKKKERADFGEYGIKLIIRKDMDEFMVEIYKCFHWNTHSYIYTQPFLRKVIAYLSWEEGLRGINKDFCNYIKELLTKE